VLLTRHFWGDKVKEKMGWACGMHEEKEKFVRRFSESLKGWDYLEDLDVDGKIILKWIKKD
jgi:hypothetical protein